MKAAKQVNIETESFQRAAKLNQTIKATWGKREVKRGIDELVGVFTDPIVMWPGGWMDTLPGWIRPEITTQRLLHLIKHKADLKDYMAQMATDIEALAYMYPATMEFPLNHEWAQIYFYLTTKCMDAAGKKIPDDLRCDNLDDYLMSQLCNLKHWIYKKRVNERKRRIRENRPPVVEVEEKPDTQLGLFI